VPRALNNNTLGSNAMYLPKHLSSPISPTFNKAIRIDTLLDLHSGQVGVLLPLEKAPAA